jgi:hypothetical protein
VTQVGSDCLVIFSAVSNALGTYTWVMPSGISSWQILTVGGGGGGGGDGGHGGGGGELRYDSGLANAPSVNTVLTIQVGNGGAAYAAGADSKVTWGGVDKYIAKAGAGGAGWNTNASAAGGTGGTGGAGTAGQSSAFDMASNTCTGAVSATRDASTGNWYSGLWFLNGGGAAVGALTTTAPTNSITGSSKNYGGAGGGGWGVNFNSANTGPIYGLPGGGTVGQYSTSGGRGANWLREPGSSTAYRAGSSAGEQGVDGTGGGGGGGSACDPTINGTAVTNGEFKRTTGGRGGAGTVVIRYTPKSPTITDSATSNTVFRNIIFTSTGLTTWSAPSGVTAADVLIVGGGGGGGDSDAGYTGGGGGAGGFAELLNLAIAPTDYSIFVGAGGSAGVENATGRGESGVDSGFASYYAGGGGGGGSFTSVSTTQSGGPGTPSSSSGYVAGGSGGGATSSTSAGSGGAAGIGTTVNGYVGANGFAGAGTNTSGWGGGGGGAGGAAPTGNFSGAGGAGKSSSIAGTSTTYSAGGSASAAAIVQNTGNGGSANYSNNTGGTDGASGIVAIRIKLISGSIGISFPGALNMGEVLTASDTSTITAFNGATYRYQWQRSSSTTGPWSNIAGANSRTYTLTTSDFSRYIRVAIIATDSYGTTTSGIYSAVSGLTSSCVLEKSNLNTSSVGYLLYKITSGSSCTWNAPEGTSSVDAFLVGGGGGGGADGGAGGGGGSINTITSITLPANKTLTVTVGTGGTAGVWGTNGVGGGTSSIGNGTNNYTAPGGSGGLGCGAVASAGGITGSGGTTVAGGAGGRGSPSCTATVGDAGAAGPTSNFTGTTLSYGGGGGGGIYPSSATFQGAVAGGAGGGGASARGNSSGNSQDGQPGTNGLGGGGGAGSAGNIKGPGGLGGSGVVFIKVAILTSGTASFSTVNTVQTRSDTFTVSNALDKASTTYSVSPTIANIVLETVTNSSSIAWGSVQLVARIGLSPGTYTETITATDKNGSTSIKVVTITSYAALSWSASNPTTVVTSYGKSTRTRLDLSGGYGTRVAQITHLTSPAPRGVTIDTSTIAAGYITLITDTGTATGTYTESITVTDGSNSLRTNLVTVTINAPPDITYSAQTDSAYPYVTQNLLINLDVANPNSYSGSGTTWTDTASNRAFTLSGSPTYSQNNGGTLAFATGKEATSNTNWANLDTFTAESWFKLKSLSTVAPCFVTSTYASNHINFAICQWNAQGSMFAGYLSSGAWQAVVGGSNLLTINTWYHAVYTVSKAGSTYTGTLYLNGVSLGSATSDAAPQTNAGPLRIGKRWDGITEYVDGEIPVVRIYTAPLTAQQVQQNYQNSKVRFVSATSVSPTSSGNATMAMTEGKSATYQVFAETGGTGTNTFALSGSNSTISLASVGTDQTSVVVSSSITANATTAKTYSETLTATDSSTAATAYYLTITVNPKIAITAVTDTLTTSFGKAAYDTITAAYGTGTLTFTRTSGSGSSAITAPVTGNQALLTAASTLPVGTYYETFTVTDSVGATTVKVIKIVVNSALTLTSATGVNQIETTFSKADSLTINVANGTGTRTASVLPVIISGVSLISTNLQNGTMVLSLSNAVAVGRYTETITVTDSTSASASLVITIIVNAAPTISYGGATSGAISLSTTAGTSTITTAFTAALGTGTRSLTLSGLNTAISLDTSTANLGYLTLGSGLTSNNSTTFRTVYETVTVTDAVGFLVTRPITITVNPAISLAAAATTLTTTAGVAITDTITATYGTGNKTFAITSSPSITGITRTTNILNQTTFTIPANVGPGTYTITVTSTDSVSATSTINVTLNVNSGINITGSNSIAMTTGYAYNTSTYSVSGGTGNYSMVLTGTLSPSFITLETPTTTSFRLKILSGAPSGSGVSATYYESVTVIDAVGGRSSFNITLTVNPVLSLTGNQTVNTTFGVAATSVYQTSGGTGPFYIQGATRCAPVRTIDGNHTVLSFVATGDCSWVAPAGVENVTALVVGGGASGDRGYCAYYYGHGGGGGQVKELSRNVSAGTSYSVVVGAGGLKTTNCGSNGYGGSGTNGLGSSGNDGGSSSFGTLTSLGGVKAVITSARGGSSYDSNGNVLTGGLPANAHPDSGYVTAGYPAGGGAGSGGSATGLNGGPGVTSAITGLMYGSGGPGLKYVGASISGTYSDGAQPAGVEPLPNRGAGGSDFTNGGSGVVVLKYLTPTVSDRTRFDVYTDTSTVSSAKIVVSIPDSVTVGTYTQTLTVRDSIPTSTAYTVTMIIAKATPTVALTLPGGGNTATYGSPVALTATSSTNGRFTFKMGGSNIANCVDKETSGGSINCVWTPTDTASVTMTADFTPSDTTNYNSATSSNLALTVQQADTLTVTFSNQTLTYSDSGTAVSRAFTLSGLASIDTVTSVSTAITGIANDSSSVNITLTKAGTFTLSGTALNFSVANRASYYKAIAYSPGTITVNRAARGAWSINFGTANVIRYGAGKTETPTATFSGDGSASYRTSSPVCSVTSAGTITTLGVGACDLQVILSQTNNWLSDTKTVTVTIYRGLRASTITPAQSTIKYGETTSVTSTVSPALDSATVTFSNNSSVGCSVDNISGLVTGIKALTACSVGVTYDQTSLYESTTAAASITINKALAPVVTTDSITAVAYTGLTSLVSPTYTVSGILARDISQILPTANVSSLTSIASIASNTYTSVSSYRYFATNPTSYDSTTAPSLGGTYAVTPQTLTLLGGVDISNYETPTYVSSDLVINPIVQTALRILLSAQESITVPYDITFTGGSSTGSISASIVSGGSATGCSISGLRLSTSTQGTCILQATKAADRNYLEVISETATVMILNFVSNVDWNAVFNSGSGITIASEVPFIAGPITCEQDCQPTITDIQDTSGVSITSLRVGQTIWIIGTNFNTATEVHFRRSIPASGFQIDSDIKIVAIIPSSISPNPGESTSTMTISIAVVASGGRAFPNTQIVTVTL